MLHCQVHCSASLVKMPCSKVVGQLHTNSTSTAHERTRQVLTAVLQCQVNDFFCLVSLPSECIADITQSYTSPA
jgi:hypothetical protein